MNFSELHEYHMNMNFIDATFLCSSFSAEIISHINKIKNIASKIKLAKDFVKMLASSMHVKLIPVTRTCLICAYNTVQVSAPTYPKQSENDKILLSLFSKYLKANVALWDINIELLPFCDSCQILTNNILQLNEKLEIIQSQIEENVNTLGVIISKSQLNEETYTWTDSRVKAFRQTISENNSTINLNEDRPQETLEIESISSPENDDFEIELDVNDIISNSEEIASEFEGVSDTSSHKEKKKNKVPSRSKMSDTQRERRQQMDRDTRLRQELRLLEEDNKQFPPLIRHKNGNYSCQGINIEITIKNDLQELKCGKCNYIVYEKELKKDSRELSNVRIRKHVAAEHFDFLTCPRCKRKVKCFTTLRRHKNCTRLNVCPICGKPFGQKSRTHVEVHMWSHYGPEERVAAIQTGEAPKRKYPIPCPHCNKFLSYQYTLDKHISTFHNENFQGKTFKCPIATCGKFYNTASGVRVHMKNVHNRDKSNYKICSICNAKFTHANALKRHLLIHKGVKSHICEVCGQSFYLRSLLTLHKDTHAPKYFRQYVCKICPIAYRHQGGLRKHMKVAHLVTIQAMPE